MQEGVTRRRVLALGLGAGAAMAMANGLRLEPPAAHAEALSAGELDVVRALAVVMFPGAPFPVDGLEAGVVERVDHLVGWLLDDAHAAGFRYALRALDWGTLASRGTRFSELAPEARLEVLEAWSAPEVVPRRVAVESFKLVLGMAYFSDPRVLGHIGWRASCGVERA